MSSFNLIELFLFDNWLINRYSYLCDIDNNLNLNAMKKFLFYSILFYSILFYSCNKSIDESKVPEEKELENRVDLKNEYFSCQLVDGMLSFHNLEEFQNAFSYISKLINEGSVQINSDGFKSYITKFEDVCNEVLSGEANMDLYQEFFWVEDYLAEKYVEPIISSPAASILFNHLGLIMINGKVYKHTLDKVFVYDYHPQELFLKNQIVDVIEVEYLRIKSHDSPISENDLNYRADLCQCDDAYSSGGRNFKLSGELSKSCVGNLYADMRVDTKHRRRSLGLWWYNDANSLAQSGSVQYCSVAGNGSSLTWNSNRSCTNCSSIRSVVVEGEGCPCLVDSNVSHSGIANSRSLFCNLTCNSSNDGTCYFNCN